MENNYETLRMPELKALTREHRLRGYSRLRKADLIGFLQNNEQRRHRPPSPPPQGVQHPLHRCLPPGHSQGALLGNRRGNHKAKHKLKPDNLN